MKVITIWYKRKNKPTKKQIKLMHGEGGGFIGISPDFFKGFWVVVKKKEELILTPC